MVKYKFELDNLDKDMVKIYVLHTLHSSQWYLAGVFHIDMIMDMLLDDQLKILSDEKQIVLIGEFKEETDGY